MEGTQTCGVLDFQDSEFLMREEMRTTCLAVEFEKADLGLHDTCWLRMFLPFFVSTALPFV